MTEDPLQLFTACRGCQDSPHAPQHLTLPAPTKPIYCLPTYPTLVWPAIPRTLQTHQWPGQAFRHHHCQEHCTSVSFQVQLRGHLLGDNWTDFPSSMQISLASSLHYQHYSFQPRGPRATSWLPAPRWIPAGEPGSGPAGCHTQCKRVQDFVKRLPRFLQFNNLQC